MGEGAEVAPKQAEPDRRVDVVAPPDEILRLLAQAEMAAATD